MNNKSRLGNLRLYKVDVPHESDVGVIIISRQGWDTGRRFQLSRHTGPGQGRRRRGRGSKAGLAKSFVNMIDGSFVFGNESNITNQIFDYIISNLCFKYLENVPPACPVLVFHFQIREFGQDHVPEMDIRVFMSFLLTILRTRDSVLTVEHAITRRVAIAPPVTEIVDCYQSSDLCCLCDKGYPKEDEIVHKTRCNHIFHATCISSYLLRTPQCPVCSAPLPPVDIRTLLFS